MRCVLDDPAIDELLAELQEVERRLKEDRGYRRPRHLMPFINGHPEDGFISHHVPRLLRRFQDPAGPYWLPCQGDRFSATVLEQKSQNWLVEPADTPGVSFYLRPKGCAGIESMTGKTVTVSVTKAWRRRGRLYVTGTMAG
jgi:hypothetical protein